MSDQRQRSETSSERTSEVQQGEATERRPYEKPGFITSVVFERAALSCGALNITPGPPPFGCSLQS